MRQKTKRGILNVEFAKTAILMWQIVLNHFYEGGKNMGKLIKEHLTPLTVGEKASKIWDVMEENERTMIRIGMFPFNFMTEAEKEGYNGRDLSVALMEIAEAKGGMIS
jgi:hypothetical protein